MQHASDQQPPSAPPKRDGFTTAVGIFAATLGSALGLGNIWKFPSLTGTNGGAAFVLTYVIATILVGLPVMISELMIGRRAHANAITSLRKLAPGKPWWLVGAAGALAAFLILAFYTEVAGWVFAYIFKSASGALASTDPEVTGAAFGALISNPWQSLIWQWIVLALITVIIIAGVSRGIERAAKTLLPILFIILIVICVRSLTLPGKSAEIQRGLSFLFKPDFSKLTFAAILAAMGLSFFKLSVGMGTMITYGSYFRDDANVPATALRVMLADVAVSLLAGIAIFPAVFAFGFEPTAGASLLFITIPAVCSSMPLGNVVMVLFFILTAIAATGAMLSLLEVPVAFLAERLGWKRWVATVATTALLVVIGSTAALSNSTLAAVKPLGMTFFDLFDYSTSNILLPLGGLFICIFVGWFWGWPQVRDALTNAGRLRNERIALFFFGVTKFVAPLLVLVVLLTGLGIIKA